MSYSTQNELLLAKLMIFYKKNNNLEKITPLIIRIMLLNNELTKIFNINL